MVVTLRNDVDATLFGTAMATHAFAVEIWCAGELIAEIPAKGRVQ